MDDTFINQKNTHKKKDNQIIISRLSLDINIQFSKLT